MTCREKYKQEHPNDPEIWDGMCPNEYGYLPIPDYCYADGRAHCEECWNREIPENIKWVCEVITIDGSRFTLKNHVNVKDPDNIDLNNVASEVFTNIKKFKYASITNDDGSVTVLATEHIVGMTLKYDEKGNE